MPAVIKRFEGKSVLITGASRGIGKGIAQRFAEEGPSLILSANEEGVHKVAEELKGSGVNALSVVCDVTRKADATDGITVNAFCPGIIETDMWAYNDAAWGKLLGNYQPGELMKEWVNNIPMKRAGKAEDVAGLVAFLASEDAAYITGQTINVDGGLIMS
jgi:NAD(P)-dependent dehydrogenase (short-subunit alcohol dehydrogenase family)